MSCRANIVAILIFVLGLSLFNSTTLTGQEDDIFTNVTLDSMTITAKRGGFNVKDFIHLMRNDSSFYMAFRNLRFVDHSAQSKMVFKNRKGKILTNYDGVIHQKAEQLCRKSEVVEETISGKFYKKSGKFRFYTAKMHHRLFHSPNRVCESSLHPEDNQSAKGMEKHIQELKKLIFNPGERARVPMIGKKTAIFSERMKSKYIFQIESRNYTDGTPCYVFSAVAKNPTKINQTVLKALETYFSKSDFQVLGRTYRLKYKTMAYQFDIQMEVDLQKIKNHYFPNQLSYSGYWQVSGKKRETCDFTVNIDSINTSNTLLR